MSGKLLRGQFLGEEVKRREVGDVVLVAARHPAGSRLARHSHEHAYFCVNYGETYTERYGRQRRSCRPGMLVFHPPGECHAQDHEGEVASLNVEVNGAWLRRVAEISAPLDQPVEFDNDEIARAGGAILRELQHSDGDSMLAIEGLTWEILSAASGGKRPGLDKRAPHWVRNARDLIDATMCVAVSLRALATEAGVHPVHFAATFRRYFGCSVGEYQRRRRIRLAHDKLADRELSLAHVAADVGFADQSHLTRAFKRSTGMTPGEYRTFLTFKTRR